MPCNNGDNMGNPAEVEAAANQHPRPSQINTKATWPGATAFIGVLSLLVTIISVAVPHWGSYQPLGSSFASGRFSTQGFDNMGHFGPFQVCKDVGYYTICGGGIYKPSNWIIIAGICGIGSILALGLFCLFSILHVAMLLQRKEIWISFSRGVFCKMIMASLAVLANFGAVVFGGIEFSFSGRGNGLSYKLGVCYYLQICLIFANALLVILSTLSWRHTRKYPLHIVTRNGRTSANSYDSNHQQQHNGNGVSMTASSGVPYYEHGAPRIPIQPQQQQQQAPNTNRNPFQTYTHDAMTSYANGHTLPTVVFSTGATATQPGPQTPHSGAIHNGSNGFTAVGLHASGSPPTINNGSNNQPLPIQSIKPIQAVQPQIHNTGIPIQHIAPNMNSSSQVMGSSAPSASGVIMNLNPRGGNGVSFTPQGRAGYSQMGHSGSMDNISLNSTLSSNLSIGSSMSTGSAQGPLRSSLKKTKQKDKAQDINSVSSKTSSKQVRISLGAEQTQV